MLVFLDTEFTDLVIRPRLLSVGIVTDFGRGREFYAEVTDPDRIHGTSWYVLSAVLPLFGRVAHAACAYAELGARLSAFLGDLVADLQTDEFVELAHGYPLDWELVDRAIKDTDAPSWESTRHRVRPVNVYELTGFGPGKRAAEAYLKAQDLALLSRHHALCDVRALRLAYEAATRASAGPIRATTLVEGQPPRRATA